jgi:hypothetical protein
MSLLDRQLADTPMQLLEHGSNSCVGLHWVQHVFMHSKGLTLLNKLYQTIAVHASVLNTIAL